MTKTAETIETRLILRKEIRNFVWKGDGCPTDDPLILATEAHSAITLSAATPAEKAYLHRLVEYWSHLCLVGEDGTINGLLQIGAMISVGRPEEVAVAKVIASRIRTEYPHGCPSYIRVEGEEGPVQYYTTVYSDSETGYWQPAPEATSLSQAKKIAWYRHSCHYLGAKVMVGVARKCKQGPPSIEAVCWRRIVGSNNSHWVNID